MGKNVYGPSINVDGTPRFTSASSLTTFDPNSFGGCNRKWFIEKVLKIKQDETEAMRKGTHLLHKPIEKYYETGVESFPPLAMSVRKYLYERGPDLLIEQEIGVPLGAPAPTEESPMTDAQLLVSPVRAGGIPIVGRMDLTHGRGYYIDDNGELIKEAHANTAEFNDWKSTSDEQYAKTAAQLREAVQMITYGKFGLVADPSIEFERLSHTYALTKGKSRGFKRTVLVPAEEIHRRWEYIDGLGREMHDVALANIEQVPANRKSCNAYGRNGCPFKHPQANGGPPLCSAGRFNSLTSLFGEAGARHLLAQAEESQQEIVPTMSIINRVNSATTATAPSVTPVNTSAAVGVQLTLGTQPSAPAAGPSGLSMLEALEAEEAAAAPVAPAPQPQLTQQHVDAFSVIAIADMGYPKTTGEATALLSAYGALCSPQRTYSPDGAGRLSGLNVHTTGAELVKLAEDLKAHAAKKAAAQTPAAPPAAPPPAPIAPPTISIVPPETPASNPAIAAVPVEGLPAPGLTTTIVQQPTPAPAAVVALPAAAEIPKGDAVAVTSAGEATPASKAKAPKNPNKVEPKKTKTDGDSFELYINCIPSKPYENLDRHIAQWCATLVGFFQDKEKDLPDIRCITSDNRMNFGKWPGPLAALVREVMVEGKLPRGVYVIDARNYSIAAEVANAMISAVREDGTPVLDSYTKGIA